MRQILNSYDQEVSSMGYEPQCNSRLRQAEANLQTCHRQIEILEVTMFKNRYYTG